MRAHTYATSSGRNVFAFQLQNFFSSPHFLFSSWDFLFSSRIFPFQPTFCFSVPGFSFSAPGVFFQNILWFQNLIIIILFIISFRVSIRCTYFWKSLKCKLFSKIFAACEQKLGLQPIVYLVVEFLKKTFFSVIFLDICPLFQKWHDFILINCLNLYFCVLIFNNVVHLIIFFFPSAEMTKPVAIYW